MSHLGQRAHHTVLSLLPALLLVSAGGAVEPEDDKLRNSLADYAIAHRAAEIKAIQAEMAADRNLNFDPASERILMAKHQEKIDALNRGDSVALPTLSTSPKAGQVGWNPMLEVVGIEDLHTLRVELRKDAKPVSRVNRPKFISAFYPLSNEEVGRYAKGFFIEPRERACQVTRNADGQLTLEPFDLEPLKQLVKQRLAAAESGRAD
jgi:hypothetical protein